MFCYQQRFDLPTRVVSKEQFWALVRAPYTAQTVKEARAALARGNKALYDKKKKKLPLMIFIGTFDESVKQKDGKDFNDRWRNQEHVRLNGLVVADYDHLEGDVREIWAEAYDRLSDENKARVVLVFVTPSGEGLKVVFEADVNVGNLIDNQLDFSAKLGLKLDESCKDGCRGAFMTTAEDIISINEEKLFTYENKEFGEKFNAEYRAGHSAPTKAAAVAGKTTEQGTGNVGTLDAETVVTYHGVPYAKIVEAWLDGKKVEPGDRHRTSLCLADHLRYITDNDPVLIERILRDVPFVADIVKERNEDVAATVKSAREYKMFKSMPKKLSEALGKVGVKVADQTTPSPSYSGGEGITP